MKAEWVSVKDQMPAPKFVLVWCTLWNQRGEPAIGFRRESSWDVEGSHVANCRVTHWMPLPDAPTSAAGANATRSDSMLDGAEAKRPDEQAPSTPVAAKQGQQ